MSKKKKEEAPHEKLINTLNDLSKDFNKTPLVFDVEKDAEKQKTEKKGDAK